MIKYLLGQQKKAYNLRVCVCVHAGPRERQQADVDLHRSELDGFHDGSTSVCLTLIYYLTLINVWKHPASVLHNLVW